MEQKLIRVPFEVELAKKITNSEVDGRIVTRNGRNVRIICFDAHCDDNIVALIEDEKGVECLRSYASDGMTFLTGKCRCDLMLEISEYMTFKDGDIIRQSNDTYTWLSIIKDIDLSDDGKGDLLYLTNEYVSMLINDGDGSIDIDTYSDAGQKVERATEEEKQKLIDALKTSKEPKAKEYLKRFFNIEVKPEFEFKPFDKVLVRNFDYNKWSADIFSHIDGDMYECVGGIWNFCIPYNEKTKHLLGTTDNWEE